MDDGKLIDLVKARPILYEEWATRLLKEKKLIWQEIATELNTSVASCKSRWNNLRKIYLNYLIRRENSNDIATYKYADQLAFLLPFLRPHNSSVVDRAMNVGLEDIEVISTSDGEDLNREKSVTEDEVTEFCMSLVPIMDRLRLEGDFKQNQIKLDIFQAVVTIVKESFEKQ